MQFNSPATPIWRTPLIKLSGKPLEFVQQFKYLGHIISSDLSDNKDIQNQNKKLCARGNLVIRKFKHCADDIKCLLFKTFCYSMYGAALWSAYSAAVINRLRVNYNNILRRMLSVPPWNSASAMFVSNGVRGFAEQRRVYCYSLMQRVLLSSNTLVQCVVHSDARALSPLWDEWHRLLFQEAHA